MDNEEKVSKVPNKYSKVKNKAPAPIQITAEQLLREAYDRRSEKLPTAPKLIVGDSDESSGLKMGKRREFEDKLRKNRANLMHWFKYARFEESLGELDRARSVYERALEMEHRNITIWLKYAEMEMRHKQINHARNLWDRAVLVLPRVNQFWYKYTYMEELLGNIANCRQVFERWMQWQPHEQAWLSYIKMELRYKEVDRARHIYERFVTVHPDVVNWIRFAKFEQRQSNIGNARIVYEKAVEFFAQQLEAKLMLAFAKFEEQCGEIERARVIYQYAIGCLPQQDANLMIEECSRFEKRHGDRRGIEDVVITKRKNFYETNVTQNCYDYDSWIDMIRMMENENFTVDTIRDCYEKAISNVPPIEEKKHWSRYIYIWIMYAIYEELTTKDIERVRHIYKACLGVIPHKKFTFAKIWILASNFEIRQKQYQNFRKLMGKAIGMCPKGKLFKEYIHTEFQMREFDRCRKLYEKYLEFNPTSSIIWVHYAEMEATLGNIERARALFQLGSSQSQLDMPELLWKSYIDFEICQNEVENTRALYKDLLERTQHVKVWISYAKYELQVDSEDNVSNARVVFERAAKFYKENSSTDEDYTSQRIALLNAWNEFEKNYGDESSQGNVAKMLPNKVKKRRKIVQNFDQEEDGDMEFGWEEYYEYIFPEDIEKQSNFKLLQMAYKWNQQKLDSNEN